jgi:hypothetical protein
LNRVDQLPILDSRSPEEIIGYDENGAPASVTPLASFGQAREKDSEEDDPEMEEWRKTFGHEIPAAVKEFLEYRHREWELAMEADLKARQEKRTKRERKP